MPCFINDFLTIFPIKERYDSNMVKRVEKNLAPKMVLRGDCGELAH